MMSDRPNTVIALPTSLARPSRREGDVERACAAFLAAQAAMVALTDSYDDFEILEFEQWRSMRDAAFEEVRALVAHTVNALLAKIRVFHVARDWLWPDDPGLAAFAVEIVIEAGALGDMDWAAMRACEAFHR